MEIKKYDRVNLDKKRGIFFEIGLILALGLVLLAFEWTSKPEEVKGFEREETAEIIQESVPVTRQQKQRRPPPPPPPKTTEVIQIVDNDVVLQDELNLQTTEADQETRVTIDAFMKDEEEEEDQIFVKVEDMPEFRGGGVDAFRRYIQKHLDYPVMAAENGIEGTVYLQFVVNKDGSISDVSILRGVDPALDEEAKTTVQEAPDWEPGRQRGRPVRVMFSIAIAFRIE